MGIRDGDECYCGNNDDFNRHGLCSNTGCRCDEPCEGNGQQWGCGGAHITRGLAISVYRISKLQKFSNRFHTRIVQFHTKIVQRQVLR